MTTGQDGAGVQQQNELDSAQASLDLGQGGNAASQYATVEQFQELQKLIISQTGGLQSKIDTGLNAIRRDAETKVAGEAARVRDQSFMQMVEELPYDQQQTMRALWEQQKQQALPADPSGLSVQERADAEMFVRNSGVDPADTRINYATLIDPSLTVDQRQQRFIDSVFTLRASPQQAAAAPVEPNAQQRVADQSPPIEGNAGTGAGLTNADAVRDAYISGRLDQATYIQRMAALGQPVQ